MTAGSTERRVVAVRSLLVMSALPRRRDAFVCRPKQPSRYEPRAPPVNYRAERSTQPLPLGTRHRSRPAAAQTRLHFVRASVRRANSAAFAPSERTSAPLVRSMTVAVPGCMDKSTAPAGDRECSSQAEAQPPPGPVATDTAMLGRTMRSAPWWARRAYPAAALLASDGGSRPSVPATRSERRSRRPHAGRMEEACGRGRRRPRPGRCG